MPEIQLHTKTTMQLQGLIISPQTILVRQINIAKFLPELG